MKRLAAICVLMLLGATQLVGAEVPKTMSYQGVLRDESGELVPDGDYQMTFRIYDSPTQPGELWEETQVLPVVAGIFDAILGSAATLDLEFNAPYWLGIAIDDDPELEPRIELAASPYTFRAAVADSALVATTGSDNDWTVDGDNMYSAVPGFIGIGTTNPTQHLEILGGTLSLRPTGEVGAQWLEIRNSEANGGILNSRVSQGDKKPLNIGAIHDGSGSPSGELCIRFSVGSVADPIQAMAIAESGRIGIGTSAPARTVEVVGEPPYLRLTSSTLNERASIELKGYRNEIEGQMGDITFIDQDGTDVAQINCLGNINYGIPFGISLIAGTGGSAGALRIVEGGNVGIGTLSPTAKLDVRGTTKCEILEITGGADLAEPFDVQGELIEAGMLVSIDPANPGKLTPSNQPYDPCVAGVVSGAGGIGAGLVMGKAGSAADGEHPVALTGRVYCLATTGNGAIQPGDFLTTSDVRGYAMKATNRERSQGAVIGKAMTGLTHGQGTVLVLVTLQ